MNKINKFSTKLYVALLLLGSISLGACGASKKCVTQTKTSMTKNKGIPFQAIDWNTIPKTEHKGEQGIAYWQPMQFEGLRVRIVEYSAGYIADHWCQKGHIVYCLEGEFTSELSDNKHIELKKGMSYIVSDDLSSHRSVTKTGTKLMIIDGDFLKNQ